MLKQLNNEEIIKLMKGLNDLQELKLPLNIKTSYILAKNKQSLTPLVNLIEQKRMELYRKYGTQKDDGSVVVPKERISELEIELNELLEVENNVELMELNLDSFGDVEIPFDILEELLNMVNE